MLKIKINKKKEEIDEEIIFEYIETNIFSINKLFNNYKTEKFIYFKNASEDIREWSKIEKSKVEYEVKKVKERRSPYKILMSLEKQILEGSEVKIEDFRNLLVSFMEKKLGEDWRIYMLIFLAMEEKRATVTINVKDPDKIKKLEELNKIKVLEEQKDFLRSIYKNQKKEYLKEEVDKIFSSLFKDLKLFKKRRDFFEGLIKIDGNYVLRHFEIIFFEKVLGMKWKKK